MKNQKGFAPLFLLLIIAGILVIGGGAYYLHNKKVTQPVACTMEAMICPDGSAVGRTGPNCEFAKCSELKSEELLAQQTLEQFYSMLVKEDYVEAVKLFEPRDGWPAFNIYAENPQKDDQPTILGHYCQSVGTCLNIKVLNTTKLAEGDYKFKVSLIKKDGTIFIAGPCCGASEEEMPSTSEFSFEVKKVNGAYRVIDPPLYRP